jgi:hypothetical protein
MVPVAIRKIGEPHMVIRETLRVEGATPEQEPCEAHTQLCFSLVHLSGTDTTADIVGGPAELFSCLAIGPHVRLRHLPIGIVANWGLRTGYGEVSVSCLCMARSTLT